MTVEDRHPQLAAKFRELKAKKRRLIEHLQATHGADGAMHDEMGWRSLAAAHDLVAEPDHCTWDPDAPLDPTT